MMIFFFQLIGKNLGQLFRKEIKIADLRPIQTSSRNASYNNLLEHNGQDTSIAKLFKNDDS